MFLVVYNEKIQYVFRNQWKEKEMIVASNYLLIGARTMSSNNYFYHQGAELSKVTAK